MVYLTFEPEICLCILKNVSYQCSLQFIRSSNMFVCRMYNGRFYFNQEEFSTTESVTYKKIIYHVSLQNVHLMSKKEQSQNEVRKTNNVRKW